MLKTLTALFPVTIASWAAGTPADLPEYRPEQTVTGTIRNFGSNLGGLLKLWEEGFRKFHPQVRFDDKLPTSDAAIPALVTGVADLGPDGSEATLTENLSFFEVHGYPLTSVRLSSFTRTTHSPS